MVLSGQTGAESQEPFTKVLSMKDQNPGEITVGGHFIAAVFFVFLIAAVLGHPAS